jgi:hypothetical protein
LAAMAATWGWRGASTFGLGFTAQMPYSFCASGDLFAPHIAGSVISGPQVAAIAANTRPWTGSSLNGRVVAHPAVSGPPPSILRIPASVIATGSGANRGVVQARAFSRPSTARTFGGSEAQRARVVYREPSHFGGRLGAGFSGAGAAYAPSYAASHPYYGSGRFVAAGVAPRSVSGGFSGYRAPPSFMSRGAGAGAGNSGSSYHTAPHATSTSYRSSGGGYHGGGGGHAGGRH